MLSTKTFRSVYYWLKDTLTVFLPSARCFLCLAPCQRPSTLCQSCWDALPRISQPCHSCGIPLAATDTQPLCGSCQSHPSRTDHLLAPFVYSSPIRELVHGFKFHQTNHLAKLLATILYQQIAEAIAPVQADLMIPVPLANSRLRQRGFNQALELSRYLSKWTSIPLATNEVERIEGSSSQVSLNGEARRHEIRNQFVVRRSLVGKSIIIVDDVVTTGATVQELARVLRAAGAVRIEVWALARTCLHQHSV